MNTSNQKLGNRGEDLAAAFLQKKGYTILNRNFRSGRSELDIVARKDTIITVCEVKSFFSDPLGAAEFRVTKGKQKQVIQGTYGYLAAHPEYEGMDVRFDVIIVDFSEYPANITHHEAAFWQEYF